MATPNISICIILECICELDYSRKKDYNIVNARKGMIYMKFAQIFRKYVGFLWGLLIALAAAFVLPKVEHDSWPDLNELE